MEYRKNTLIRAVGIGLLVVGCAHFQNTNNKKLEGNWECTTLWSWDKEGESVPCSAKQQTACVESVLSSTGVISLGGAQWSETIEGTCYASEEELYGTRTSVNTVPENDAARQFEEERLEGKTLSDLSPEMPQEFRLRITSLTETQLKAVNKEGRTITCNRL